jgi:signal transduction histidine kinase
MRNIDLNATEAHDLALHIEAVHQRSTHIAIALDSLCVLLTCVGATLLWQAIRARMVLVDRHRELVEARAEELEEFAGRVAHDILSPLSVVTMALRLASTDAPSPPLERAQSAVKRVSRLVDGLLDFAIAGARPRGDATDPRAVLDDLAPDLRASAKAAGIALDVDVSSSHQAACHAGVLTSIVSNLAHNAIKYIGDREPKEVHVRVRDTRDGVRIEVEDTGPGLPPGLGDRVFEPYIQAKHQANRSGIGLGLATVKRMTKAHGGRVGVVSRPGEGSTFWVELPRPVGGSKGHAESS